MKRAVRWWAINGLIAAFMVAWMLGVEPARNVVMAAVWLQLLIVGLSTLCADKIKERARKIGRSVPQYASVTYDALFTAALAWQGSPFLAVAFAISCASQESWWNEPDKDEEVAA